MGRILRWELMQLCQSLVNGFYGTLEQVIAMHMDELLTLYCRNTRILGRTKTFSDQQPSTSSPDCSTMLPLFVFIW